MSNVLTLSAIVDEVNDKRLFGKEHCCGRRVKLCRTVSDQQGQPGSYGQLFAPVGNEIADGYRFFTGERITTRAGASHILGEEALRALVIMQPKSQHGQKAIGRAADWVSKRLHQSETEHGGGMRKRGTYCCNSCTVALWRTWNVGIIDEAADRLHHGLKFLKTKRDGEGDWRGFKFYYVLSALIEAENDLARKELRYAKPLIERRLTRAPKNTKDVYKLRRRRLLELALEAA